MGRSRPKVSSDRLENMRRAAQALRARGWYVDRAKLDQLIKREAQGCLNPSCRPLVGFDICSH